MIGVEKIGEIRRAYFEQYRSIKEIVRTLSVSRAAAACWITACPAPPMCHLFILSPTALRPRRQTCLAPKERANVASSARPQL